MQGIYWNKNLRCQKILVNLKNKIGKSMEIKQAYKNIDLFFAGDRNFFSLGWSDVKFLLTSMCVHLWLFEHWNYALNPGTKLRLWDCHPVDSIMSNWNLPEVEKSSTNSKFSILVYVLPKQALNFRILELAMILPCWLMWLCSWKRKFEISLCYELSLRFLNRISHRINSWKMSHRNSVIPFRWYT